MPQLVYFICSESVTVDKETNKFTAFNIVEQMMIVHKEQMDQAIKSGHQFIPPMPIRIISVWMRDDSDPLGTRFENELLFHFPNMGEIVVARTETIFAVRFNRLITPPMFIAPLSGPGLVKIESRLRKSGDQEWICRAFTYLELVAFDLPALTSVSPTAPVPPSLPPP